MKPNQHYLYMTWYNMLKRCSNKDNPSYGGKGIYVCDEWKNDFWQFVEDMGDRPDDHTLDRIDNSGPYHPDNCRWADHSTQMKNRDPWKHKPGRNYSGHREKALMIIEDLKNGMSQRTIAAKHGVSRRRVQNLWNEIK